MRPKIRNIFHANQHHTIKNCFSKGKSIYVVLTPAVSVIVGRLKFDLRICFTLKLKLHDKYWSLQVLIVGRSHFSFLVH